MINSKGQSVSAKLLLSYTLDKYVLFYHCLSQGNFFLCNQKLKKSSAICK